MTLNVMHNNKTKIIYKRYKGQLNTNEDYDELHNFLVSTHNEQYTYARFDWMMTNREYLDDANLDKIGIWKDNNNIVAVVMYDHSLDDVYPIYLSGYEFLFKEMLTHIENIMMKVNPDISIFVSSKDNKFRQYLSDNGYQSKNYKDTVMRIDLDNLNDINLPNDYRFVTLSNKDYSDYYRCLYKGFDHEANNDPYNFNEKLMEDSYERKYVDLDLKVSILHDKKYIAHCGIWYDTKSDFAIVEPVCVIPEYRNKSYGRHVVLEGLNRAKIKGAKYAVVGSNSDFYKKIGFKEYLTGEFFYKKQ